MVMVSMGLVALCLVIFVGTIAFAVWTIGRPLRALTRPIEELAKGNCVVSVPGVRRGDEIGQIANAVSTMAEKVSATISEIKLAAREVTNASVEIATSTTDLSQRTEEQADRKSTRLNSSH